MKVAMIMLAAGVSRRFGSNKLFYPVDGILMYRRILEQLTKVRESLPEIYPQLSLKITIVTGYDAIAEEGRAAGAEVLYNPHPEEGISSSLQIGLNGNRQADACLFVVSDQPWLKAETIQRLFALFLENGKGIACVSGDGKLGNPCIFSAAYYPELLRLTGDFGGKRVIAAHRDDTAVLEVKNKKELTDIDHRGII